MLGLQRRKGRYFCHELLNVFEPHSDWDDFNEVTVSKASYIIDSIRGFLKHDDNFYGMAILDRMEMLLSPHIDPLETDGTQLAIIHMLMNKKEKFLHTKDENIKKLFGTCPFNTIQELVSYAGKLKIELSDDCLEFIFKNKLKLKGEWTTNEFKFKPLSEQPKPVINDIFYKEMVIGEEVKKPAVNTSFSMKYDGPTQVEEKSPTKKYRLEDAYEKYKTELVFSQDDFTKYIQQVLSTNKSNNELQNELFETLGFGAFELISEILDNRNVIIAPESDGDNAPMRKRRPPEVKKDSSPTISSQIIVQSEEDKFLAKQIRKIEKKEKKAAMNMEYYDPDPVYDENEELLAKELLLTRSMTALSNKSLPHVHDEQGDVNIKAMICGHMASIPQDAVKRSTPTYDEITIPAKEKIKPSDTVPRLEVQTMDDIGKLVFKDIESFNHIQSEVYPTAYHTNENMLICAPTGAGKTNIALLAIVQQIKNFLEDGVVRLNKFKIVYICPMKALASEMTTNFGKKLLPLGITVKECTGDMQLSRKEIQETQMLVTTPEKWDVISRKGTTDAELTSLLKLLIIDEVHLLNSDRGPVIEALVARTLRQVIHSQNMIRIVGLSATLPNYLDVAHFLRVNPEVGLFYFDSRYRSVPLSQTFIGVKATKSIQQSIDMDEVCFDKVVQFLSKGHQVMVFVHARNQTTKTAMYIKETAQKKGMSALFEPSKSFKSKKAGMNCSNKLLENFIPYGLGVHHAGMLRKDRNEVERCFLDGAIKVLCCTATLAWGVNLPAHGVIIKGTQLYDSKRGAYVDLDILDVMQIFGRAGRPQFDTSGSGIIITTHDKTHFYLSSLTNQVPIESKLKNALTDNLNAEIVLGSVSSIQEAVEWLTFTYLHRRMKMNPQEYGLNYSDLQNDPDLREAMLCFIHNAATALDKAKMIRYDLKTGDLVSTNLGRTASYYYINFDTIETFNELMNPTMSVPDIVSMMCLATEFQQIQVRQEELQDLDELYEDCEWAAPGGVENVHGKVNVLMQTYLHKAYIKSLSLASDMEYITQSAARIARSLFDIAIHRGSPLLAGRCLLVAQMFEQRLWPTQTPMRQFKFLESTVLENIEKFNLDVHKIRDMEEREIAQAIRNVRLASKVKHCADAFPCVEIDSTLQPITRGVIRVKLSIHPMFTWSTTYHNTTEVFYVWIEDPDNDCIYHTETCTITKNSCISGTPIAMVFTVPLVEPHPSQYLVRVSSDRWMHAVYTHPLSFLDLQLPQSFTPHTDLLELQPLEVSVLGNPLYQSLYPFSHFNPVQTQIFHCLYHTDNNVLLGAPTGSGKTIAAEICIFRLFNNNPNLKVVYIAPLKALVRERVEDWKKKFGGTLNKKVIEITGDVTPSPGAIISSDVIITTPEKWDGMSRGWQTRNFIRDVGLMVIDEIHLLGEDRGPVLEVIVSRTNFISDRTGRKLRIVGLSTAMANARDLATWLGIGEMGLYNFRPSVRPVPIEVHISGFPGKHYCPRMMSMNRPAYQAIRQHAPDSPSLIFCSSRKQTRLTAFDLITYLVTDSDPKQWLHCDESAMEMILSNVSDPDLRQFLSFGIGIHHAGLQERDRKTVEELFVNMKIQVLIATGTLAWGVNFPAHLVVIKGTEYFDGAIKRYVDMPITDVLQMMGRAGRPQFDTSGVACVFVHDIKKNFYKKFLYEPFPVESNLLQVLPDHINAEIAAETVPTKTNLMEYMTWTYFFRRLLENPSYYNLPDVQPEQVNSYLSELVDSVVDTLQDSNCVIVAENDEGVVTYESTFFGQVASYYYLSHKTMLHFQENLRCDNSILELLLTMCRATEYALFPVRHNEDKINQEIVKRFSLKLHGESVDSPHAKVYILLHMYLSDLELPNQEYIVDCKSVLDQALRILQAMIDISANSGWLSVTIKIIHLIQMLVQGKWISEPNVLTIPHITMQSLPAVQAEFKASPPLRQFDPFSISSLRYASLKNDHALETAFTNVFGGKSAVEMKKYISNLPWVELKMSIKNLESEEIQDIKEGSFAGITMDGEYELVVEFYRKSVGDSLEVKSKKFPKKKDEGWMVCVGRGDELCSIKRVTLKRKTNISIRLDVPNCVGNFTYSLFLLSDSYLGLDQQYNIPIQVKN